MVVSQGLIAGSRVGRLKAEMRVREDRLTSGKS